MGYIAAIHLADRMGVHILGNSEVAAPRSVGPVRAVTEVVDVAQVVRLAPRSNPNEWMDRGSCRGRTELFFAPFGEQADARMRREAIARAICTSCEVLTTCRDYAREHREQGFWGGENDDERTLARRRRRLPSPDHLTRTAVQA